MCTCTRQIIQAHERGKSMQHEELQLFNSVIISGEVVETPVFSHSLFGEGFYIFKISVNRLSDKADVLPVTVSERLVDVTTIEEGQKLSINGQIRSYNNYIETEKRNKLVITVFAREIKTHLDDEPFGDYNDIMLNGYICKSPVYRTTPFGREISDILLAVNRSYNKSDYIPCISWGRNAKFCEQLEVGTNVKINGRLQSRVYQKKISETQVIQKVAYEISITKIEKVN